MCLCFHTSEGRRRDLDIRAALIELGLPLIRATSDTVVSKLPLLVRSWAKLVRS